MNWLKGMLISCALGLAIAAQPLPQASISVWESRLANLRPSEPIAYFELAEEVADVATQPAERELAKHLFALAAALDADRLGRSSCLALADMEPDDLKKRRLLALGSMLGAGSAILSDRGSMDASRTEGAVAAPVALAVSEALSHYRRGLGPRVLEALRAPGAMELLQQYERVLPGGMARFLEDCKQYKGQSRPSITAGDLIGMLQLESALLSGSERPWSSDLLITGGQPLIEVDPERLAEMLGIDGSKPFYRNGRWTGK